MLDYKLEGDPSLMADLLSDVKRKGSASKKMVYRSTQILKNRGVPETRDPYGPQNMIDAVAEGVDPYQVLEVYAEKSVKSMGNKNVNNPSAYWMKSKGFRSRQ